jgi:death-on-curing protein
MSDRIIFYPSVEEVKLLHEALIKEHGGNGGVRDEGLLASALHRPQSGYYEDLFQQAAALLHSLVMNHCFIDGNKRVAFATTDIFLRLNGYVLEMDADEAEEFLIKNVIQKKIELEQISDWLKAHC